MMAEFKVVVTKYGVLLHATYSLVVTKATKEVIFSLGLEFFF